MPCGKFINLTRRILTQWVVSVAKQKGEFLKLPTPFTQRLFLALFQLYRILQRFLAVI